MSEKFWKQEIEKILKSGQVSAERTRLRKISFFRDRMYEEQTKDGLIYWLKKGGWSIPENLGPTTTAKYGVSKETIEDTIENRAKLLLEDIYQKCLADNKEGIDAIQQDDWVEVMTYPKKWTGTQLKGTELKSKTTPKGVAKTAAQIQRQLRASQSRAEKLIKTVWVKHAGELKTDLKELLKTQDQRKAQTSKLDSIDAAKGYGSSFLYEHSDLQGDLSANTVAASEKRRQLRGERRKPGTVNKQYRRGDMQYDEDGNYKGLEKIAESDAYNVNYASGQDEYEMELFKSIDETFGFEIVEQYNENTGKFEDVHVITTGSRGTKETNAGKDIRQFDASKHIDRGVNHIYDVIAGLVGSELREKYKNNPAKIKAIAASDTLGERGKKAIKHQARKGLKSKLKSKKGVTVKYAKEEKPKNIKRKKPKAINRKGKSSTKKRTRRAKRQSIGTLVTTKRAATASAKAASSVITPRKGGAHSPIALQQLLNKALAGELQKRMTGVYPRKLEFRTGRFAQSAEVTSIVPFPRMTQINYTYQKDPYEVFERNSGHPLASAGRDPQNLIGGTIRELAQSIMGTKFGLVRTKRV